MWWGGFSESGNYLRYWYKEISLIPMWWGGFSERAEGCFLY